MPSPCRCCRLLAHLFATSCASALAHPVFSLLCLLYLLASLFATCCVDSATVAASVGQSCGNGPVAGLAKLSCQQSYEAKSGYLLWSLLLCSIVATSCKDVSSRLYVFTAFTCCHACSTANHHHNLTRQTACAGSCFPHTSRLRGSRSCLLDQLARCPEGQHGCSLQSSCHQSGLAGWQIYWRHS